MDLVILPKPVGFGKLAEFNLTVLVKRFAEYFAWTNMTMQFKFVEDAGGLFPSMWEVIPPENWLSDYLAESQTVESSSHNKFFTRTDEVYECISSIPIPMGPYVTVVFSNMTFQAFEAESDPSDDRKNNHF